MSQPERILWQALRKGRMGLRFRRQHPAGPFVLDFYCDSAKLCVEVDGAGHDFTQRQDAARDRWLSRQGVRTLRIAAREIYEDLDAVVRMIVAAGQAPSGVLRTPPPHEGAGLKGGT
jgi:very-short-patch-repair endonuclease